MLLKMTGAGPFKMAVGFLYNNARMFSQKLGEDGWLFFMYYATLRWFRVSGGVRLFRWWV